MKILLLTTRLQYGGIGVYTVTLAEALKQRGHSLRVASGGGELVAELEARGIEHIYLNINTKSEVNPIVWLASGNLIGSIEKNKPNIIHAQTRVTQVLAYLVWRRRQIPYVSTCHGFFRPRLGRRVFPCWGQKAIAISEAVREHLVNDLKVKKENVSLVYNGVDTERFKRSLAQNEAAAYKSNIGLKDGPVIGVIARLSPVKGHRFLLMAMKEVLRDVPEAQLLIIGDGPIKAELVNLALQLNIAGSVFLEGSTPDTTKPLSIIDVFVLPSLQEGLGLSIMEAMAAGRPVVGTDVGGVYSLIKDGKTGLLVPPQDATGLAQAILELLKDRDKANRLGQQAQRFVTEKFSLDHMVDEIEKVYRQVISTQNP